MSQSVSSPPVNAEVPVSTQDSPREICGVQNDTWAGFYPEYIGFFLSTSITQCSTLIFIYIYMQVPVYV